MTVLTPTREHATPGANSHKKPTAQTAPALLHELQNAHLIIRNALAVMTVRQKAAWAQLNQSDKVDGEGVTRANERALVIRRAQEAA